MATYIVCYDLMRQGQNYACIVKRLEAYPTHWHMQQSVWVIETGETAVQIRDNLGVCLDQNDKLFVSRLQGEAAWMGYSDEIGIWVRARLGA